MPFKKLKVVYVTTPISLIGRWAKLSDAAIRYVKR